MIARRSRSPGSAAMQALALTVRRTLGRVWPVHHIYAETAPTLGRRGFLARLAPQAVLLERDRKEALPIAKELGERVPIILQRSGPALIPVVLQVDTDQLAQHRAVQGVAGLGEELPESTGSPLAHAFSKARTK